MSGSLTRRRFLAGSAGGGALLLGGGSWALSRERQREEDLAAVRAQVTREGMNVVLICLDTLRADHVGAYRDDGVRPDRAVRTPSFDALARSGLRFRHARPEALPTGPTRRSVYTGIRTFPMDGWRRDPDSPRIYGWQHIPPAQATLPELLGAAGYRTAKVTDNAWLLKPSWLGFRRSWDDFVGVPGQEHQRLLPGRSIRGVDVERHLATGLRAKPAARVRTHRGVVARYLANQAGREREQDWSVARVFRAASRWLERAPARQPFFLSIDSYDPHEPWDPPRRYIAEYDDPEPRGVEPISPLYGRDDYLDDRLRERMRALYAGEVTLADHWMGVFLERLDELGLAERTLVVAYSDHGHSLSDRGYVGKAPSQMYAEMVDVPLVVRHPEGRAAGAVSDYLVQLHDLAPTILATVGVPVPHAMEGHDVSPLLAGGDAPGREVQTAGYNEYVWAGDGRYAMIASNRGANARLFDRRADPGERRDLAADRPDEVDRLWDAVVRDAGGEPLPRY